MVADYYHPMSFYRDVPGARFGHRNRVGEACSYWNGSYHMIGVLRTYCLSSTPDSCTMTHCEDSSLPSTTTDAGAPMSEAGP
jgi:hypothetical protein